MIELNYLQKSPEWFSARRGLLTGSRVGAVFAKTTAGKPTAARQNLILELALERITGESEPVYVNQAMQIGAEREPLAREAYQPHSGILMRECGLIVHESLKVGSSPDGLSADMRGGLEIKCPGAKAHFDCLTHGVVPAEYMPQVLHHIWLAELDWCDFVSYHPSFPERLQLFVCRVSRDEVGEQLEQHITGCAAFLADVDAMVDKVIRMAV
jgi:putative phage-type endonuclease